MQVDFSGGSTRFTKDPKESKTKPSESWTPEQISGPFCNFLSKFFIGLDWFGPTFWFLFLNYFGPAHIFFDAYKRKNNTWTTACQHKQPKSLTIFNKLSKSEETKTSKANGFMLKKPWVLFPDPPVEFFRTMKKPPAPLVLLAFNSFISHTINSRRLRQSESIELFKSP